MRLIQNLPYSEAIQDFNNKNYEKALKSFLEYLVSEKDNKFKMVYIRWITLALFKLKRLDEAFLHLETVLEHCKDYTDLYYIYFRLLLFVGRTEEASSILETIHSLGDAICYPEYITDVKKVSDKDWDKVYNRNSAIYEDKRKNDLNFTTEELFDFGNMLNIQGRYEEAIGSYLNFLERKDMWAEHSISACCNISDCYFSIGDLKNAKKYCCKSFQYDLPRSEACCKLGFLFLQENKVKEAIFWYELSTKLKRPDNHWALYHEPSWTWLPHLQLCVCYDKLGDHKTAYEHNEIARKYNPNNESILYNQGYFKDLGYE